ncbi:TPA: aldolase/citrate lyase family protein [Bacillus cereus]|uniref:aldolase/citrate lyase family protein n=1 Tax=Bacillus cereus group TaxID=86661 RepID=UPI000978A989|nr:aldolase/citrate lyase family protein [Bacillus cereus]ONH01839.1 aldolase [Bacillus cereus]
MTLKLMYITNQEEVAKIAEKSGVDWIFIDLEINGKDERQGHLDTVISRHNINDVKNIKKILKKSELLVRVNPIYDGSEDEINKVIQDGADIVMLPFFKTKEEVETFVTFVNARAKVCLLCETAEAVKNMDDILKVQGIDYIHIGLNDLHLSYNKRFMFELLVDGTVEALCNKFKANQISYGFGGIAQIGQGALPAENIIAEHVRLGSNMAILSRSFCNTSKTSEISKITEVFKIGIKEIREYEDELSKEKQEFFDENQRFIHSKVEELINSIVK